MKFKGKEIQGVLLDITGVLIECSATGDGTAVPGSAEAIRLLRDAKIPVRYVTNETTKTRKDLFAVLHRLGFEMLEEEIFTPALAATSIIAESGLRPYVIVKDGILPDLTPILSLPGEKNCVVIADAAECFNYQNLNEAFRILIRTPESQLFTLGKGRYYREDGELTLDVGPFAAALEYAIDRKAQVIGKPDPSFFHEAIRSMSLSTDNVVMVGDDIRSDVNGAQKCGISGVLVRSGKYQPSDENLPDIKPDSVEDDLLTFVKNTLSQ